MQFRKKRLLKEVTFHIRGWLDRHPDLPFRIELTDIKISNDLGDIKLYVFWEAEEYTAQIMSILNKTNYLARQLIVEAINFKRAPKLRFFFDSDEVQLRQLKQVMTGLDERQAINTST